MTDAQGKFVITEKPVVAPSNTKQMSVALNAPVPGVCTVSWVAVVVDGHHTRGHYTFTVK